MTELLKKAFDKIAEEFTDYEQDEFAKTLLAMIESDERRWDEAFAKSADKLAQLADQAIRDFHEGRTELLDPDKL